MGFYNKNSKPSETNLWDIVLAESIYTLKLYDTGGELSKNTYDNDIAANNLSISDTKGDWTKIYVTGVWSTEVGTGASVVTFTFPLQPCPAGNYIKYDTGKDCKCTECAPGTFAEGASSVRTSCIPCAANTYASESGSSSCGLVP